MVITRLVLEFIQENIKNQQKMLKKWSGDRPTVY